MAFGEYGCANNRRESRVYQLLAADNHKDPVLFRISRGMVKPIEFASTHWLFGLLVKIDWRLVPKNILHFAVEVVRVRINELCISSM